MAFSPETSDCGKLIPMDSLITPREKKAVIAVAAICFAVMFWVVHLIQLRQYVIGR